MVDIHSHILPNIDDGSKSIEQSCDMAKMYVENDVKTVVATPHLHLDVGNVKSSIEKFIFDRHQAYEQLKGELKVREINIELLLGAEVYFSRDAVIALRNYVENDGNSNELISKITLAGTNFILVEFPQSAEIIWIKEACQILLSIGLKPIIAHVERYVWAKKRIELLSDLKQQGVVFQINASSCYKAAKSFKKGIVYKLFENGLVTFVATDAHNLENRRPELKNITVALQSITAFQNGGLLYNSEAVCYNEIMKNSEFYVAEFFVKSNFLYIFKRIKNVILCLRLFKDF